MRDSTLQDYQERMLRVLEHIQRNLDEELSLEDLAGIACFSPYHFHRIFRGMLGESVKEHVRRLRLERAAVRLKRTDDSVTMIAFDAGYEAHEAFTRAFKTMAGVAPSAFRASNGHNSQVAALAGVHYVDEGELGNFEVPSGGEKMDVKFEVIEPIRVAYVHHVGPYSACGSAWEKLGAWLGKEGLLGGGARHIGLCYDDPEVTPPERIRYDACVTVDEDFVPKGEVGVQTIDGGEYAVTTHFGPYERFGETYARFFGQWLPQSGRELRSAPCLEIYLNDPEGTDPDDLITDIYAPLEPRK